MTLQEFYEKEKNRNELSRRLTEDLERIFDNIDFVTGMLNFAKRDEDRQLVLDYIKAGNDVDDEHLILLGLEIKNKNEAIKRANDTIN